MARMPGAVWQGEHGSRRMTRYDIVCVHTIVGYAPAHAAHFSVKADGTIIQSRDTAFQSAANLNGNHRVISIENEDHGSRFGGTPRLPRWVPLTPEQVEANARILRWAHETHGIPLQLNPNSRPSSRGLGYHRQGIDGNFAGYKYPGRVSGGEVWTAHRGKVCPTDVRIDQLPDILALAIGEDMPLSDEDIQKVAAAVESRLLGAEIKLDKDGTDAPFARVVRWVRNDGQRILSELRKLNAKLDGGEEPTPPGK